VQIRFSHQKQAYTADLSQPLDISLPLKKGLETVNCFFAPPMEITPVKAGDFVGSVKAGSPVNFMNVKFNPHGNGTHTECVGHLTPELYSIREALQNFHFPARLISVFPQKLDNGDRVITRQLLEAAFAKADVPALLIRTLPNTDLKQRMHYSGTNPPYLQAEAAQWLVEQGIEHLLIDLPSVDREEDGGKLAGHRAFWQYPDNTRKNATITELIFVPDSIKDGWYLLNLQVASFELDASPSKPVLYRLKRESA